MWDWLSSFRRGRVSWPSWGPWRGQPRVRSWKCVSNWLVEFGRGDAGKVDHLLIVMGEGALESVALGGRPVLVSVSG